MRRPDLGTREGQPGSCVAVQPQDLRKEGGSVVTPATAVHSGLLHKWQRSAHQEQANVPGLLSSPTVSDKVGTPIS